MSMPPDRNSSGRHDSGGSNWLMILLIIGLVLLLVCGGLCGGCVMVARRAGQNIQEGVTELAYMAQLSPAYTAASEAVQSDPQVRDRLGEPIEQATPPERQGEGDLKPAGETFQFDVKGPEGTGIVSAIATADGSQWRLSKVTVTFEDGSVVEIPKESFDPSAQPAEIPVDGGDVKIGEETEN